MVVCFPEKGKGKFLRLKKEAVPTQNLPKRSGERSPKIEEKHLRKERHEKRANRTLLLER